METTQQRTGFFDLIVSEIPAYLHWLLNEWTIPRDVADPLRYNVATYHHPELAEALDCFSPEAELYELMATAYLKRLACGIPIEVTTTEIEAALRAVELHRTHRLLTFRNACGTYLSRLAKKHPEHLIPMRNQYRRWWVLRPGLY